MSRRVVLLGGGHAHVQVLQALARQPLADAQAVLITPFARQMYSGMVPGLVAGHYQAAQCAIALAPLARAAGIPLIETQAVALDSARRVVHLADGRSAEYDLLSLNTGASMDRARLPGAREHALFVRPIEHFVALLDGLVALARQRVLEVVVIGGGAAGVELALALRHRLRGDGQGVGPARLTLLTGGPPPLAGHAPGVMRRGLAELQAQGVTVQRQACVALEPGQAVLADGSRLACDAPLLATGAEAPPWLAASGLALDVQGFVSTGPTLQSVSHPEVFAVGDVASRRDAPHPRSGVYAVRAGAPLALNLQRLLAGGPLLPYRPQARTLNLISCGGRSAILSWGGWSAQGPWAWWWKDRIDRAFVARHSKPDAQSP